MSVGSCNVLSPELSLDVLTSLFFISLFRVLVIVLPIITLLAANASTAENDPEKAVNDISYSHHEYPYIE